MSKLPESVVNNGRCGYGDVFFNKKFQIIVWDKDKISEPHFHIIDTETSGRKFHCRISLVKPKYINETSSYLSSRQINSLIRHLSTRHKRLKSVRWNLLIGSWNMNNQKQIHSKKIPDYKKLK